MQQRPETPPGADSSPECGISGVGPRQASRISILNSDSRTVVEEGELCHFPCSVLQRTATVVDVCSGQPARQWNQRLPLPRGFCVLFCCFLFGVVFCVFFCCCLFV